MEGGGEAVYIAADPRAGGPPAGSGLPAANDVDVDPTWHPASVFLGGQCLPAFCYPVALSAPRFERPVCADVAVPVLAQLVEHGCSLVFGACPCAPASLKFEKWL